MLFDKVKREHIIQGIKDFEDKGYPNGFGPSSTYDLVFEGKKYPPKTVMAYANYHATGENPTNNFRGGSGHDCFKALKLDEKLELSFIRKPALEGFLRDSVLSRAQIEAKNYSN